MTTIANPDIPFFVSLPIGQIRSGRGIIIVGKSYNTSDRFAINFIQACSAIQSCLFHFDSRFDQGETVCNTSYPDGTWDVDREERKPLSIVRGRSFCIEIKCMPGHFKIMVDDHHHCDFAHRFCMSKADALQITGPVKIYSIQFE